MRPTTLLGAVMDTRSSSPQRVEPTSGTARHCVFCMEEIRPGASACPHCGNNLAPLQNFADRHAAFEQRLAALEQEVAVLRVAGFETATIAETAGSMSAESLGPPAEIKWPHMADNIFLGLATLLAAHWLATTLPGSNRTVFRLVALVVALPFGFRFEHHARSGTSGQVVAALAFGSIGTLCIGLLDIAQAGHAPPALSAGDIVASVAAIALSHFAGSALASARRKRANRDMAGALATRQTSSLPHIEPTRIKTTAEAVKALYDAAAPLAAGAAALWAAFGHILS
jgi:hypothetical protein